VELEFSGELWFWKGPSPWHFITVPDEDCGDLELAAAQLSYGWGMIPVTAQIGQARWVTSLWPKDGRYVVPVKSAIRRSERLAIGETVTIRLGLDI
jgi:hypothetical protein